MKKIIVILVCIILLSSCNKNNKIQDNNFVDNTIVEQVRVEQIQNDNEIQDFPKLMYVTSREGFITRSRPSLSGDLRKTLSYGEMVQVFLKQNDLDTIDGVDDYWYAIGYYRSSRSWIYGRYLSEELPEDLPVIIGRWDDVDNERQYYDFSIDNSYGEGYKDTDIGVWGTWSLDGNTLMLTLDSAMNYVTIDPPDIDYVQINIIDRNNINLQFSNNEIVKLTRNTTGW
ncbi:MAG: SH3 domain-containing protein [Treponema sp.]|jgi:hypothetical protein|nr:SH3 domain-containing protein [Treponema sp.]